MSSYIISPPIHYILIKIIHEAAGFYKTTIQKTEGFFLSHTLSLAHFLEFPNISKYKYFLHFLSHI